MDKGPRRCLWLTHKFDARLEYAGDFFGGLEAYPAWSWDVIDRGIGRSCCPFDPKNVNFFACKICLILVIKNLVLVPDTDSEKKPGSHPDWVIGPQQ